MFRDDLYANLKMLQAHQRELERKLEIARLVADSRPDRIGPAVRVLLRLGDFLILTGQALKARYQPGYPCGRDFVSGAR